MKREMIIKEANNLVNITIDMHDKGLLGKEKMSTFIKKYIDNKISYDDYNEILHIYNRLLAEAGYEIKMDICHFDIIDYNSKEYEIYYRI